MTDTPQANSNQVSQFDIDELCASLARFLQNDEKPLVLKHYLQAYRQLNKFFEQMGTMFAFISRDVHDKIEILDKLINDPDQWEQYLTLQSMILFEKSNGKLSVSQPPSGTRTFTRLHRAIQFVQIFVQQLSQAPDDSGTSELAKSAYKDTLAHHHSWLIQKGVGLALKLMPNRKQLLVNVLGEDQWNQMQPEDINKHFAEMSRLTGEAFEKCEQIIVSEQVHNLP